MNVDAPHTAEMLELASVMKAKGKFVVFGVGESIMENIITDTTGVAYTVMESVIAFIVPTQVSRYRTHANFGC